MFQCLMGTLHTVVVTGTFMLLPMEKCMSKCCTKHIKYIQSFYLYINPFLYTNRSLTNLARALGCSLNKNNINNNIFDGPGLGFKGKK